MKFIFYLIIPLILVPDIIFPQNFKKEKRIYMLDITMSMWGQGGGPNIFDDVKNALYAGIKEIKDPETIITIIPFQATHTYQILPDWTFRNGDITFDKMKTIIDSYTKETVPRGFTDIYSAIEIAKTHIDRNRINYIFLLTDGEQSTITSGVKETSRNDYNKDSLYRSLNRWCDWANNNNSYLFYVMLTDFAKDVTAVDIIDDQCRAWVVNGTNMDISFIKPDNNLIQVNLHDNPNQLEIKLDANNWDYIKDETIIKLTLQENSIFKLKENKIHIVDNKLTVNLINKQSFSELRNNNHIESILQIALSTDENVKILEPNINILVKNKKERVLKLDFIDNEE